MCRHLAQAQPRQQSFLSYLVLMIKLDSCSQLYSGVIGFFFTIELKAHDVPHQHHHKYESHYVNEELM